MNTDYEPSRIPEVPRRPQEGSHSDSSNASEGELPGIMTPRLIIGVLLAVVGAIYLLGNLGVLNDEFLSSWWPAGLVVLGLVQICFGDSAFPRVLGMGLTVLGGLLLLGNLQPDLLSVADLWKLWPLALVFVGGLLVYRSIVPKAEPIDRIGDTTSIFAMLSGQARSVTSQAFRGGELTAIMGGYELDLTEADIPEGGEAVLDTFSLMGGGEIRVPKNWEVSMEVTPFMGGVDAKTASPPRDDRRRVLRVRGFALMGGLEVKN